MLVRLLTRPPALPASLVRLEKTSYLSLSELEEAERRIVKNVQNQAFPEELSRPDGSKGPLAKLKPSVTNGVLRDRRRLNCADLDYDAKHLIILPEKHRVTEVIILHYHLANSHVGPHQLLAETRQWFWIVNGISSIRGVLQRCLECKRQNARVGEQITAPLLAVRVSSDSHQLIYPFAAAGLRSHWTPYKINKEP